MDYAKESLRLHEEEWNGKIEVISTVPVNNEEDLSLAFPGIFIGTFDAHASDINEQMKLAAAKALAELIPDDELNADHVIPKAFDPRVKDAVAAAVACAARESGVARKW